MAIVEEQQKLQWRSMVEGKQADGQTDILITNATLRYTAQPKI